MQLCNTLRKSEISLYKGDRLDVEFTVSWELGSPVDLSNFNARFSVMGTSIMKDSEHAGQITILVPANMGKLRVAILPADTVALQANYEFTYDAEIYDDSGNVYTFAQGIFVVI